MFKIEAALARNLNTSFARLTASSFNRQRLRDINLAIYSLSRGLALDYGEVPFSGTILDRSEAN
jgi:hypothetical protein